VWGGAISNAMLSNSDIVAADVAFGSDYDISSDSYSLLIGLATGGDAGDVYRVNGSFSLEPPLVTDLNVSGAYGSLQLDIASVTVSGNFMMAGAYSSAQVYYSSNNGVNWARSHKPPTGASHTSVLLSSGKFLAATSGAESAVSISSDDGSTWNQVSMIDSKITDLLDLAVAPDSLYLITRGGKHALWCGSKGGTGWQRIFSAALSGVDTVEQIELCLDNSNTFYSCRHQ